MKQNALFTRTTLFIFIFILFAPLAQAQKLVVQGFWWDYWNGNYPNGWANYLTDLAPRLKEMGVDAVWIPPTIKNGNQGVGYSPFDHYDLGDKYQKNILKTRLGTKDELLRMIAVLHANGIEVVQDVVLNHVDNAGSANGSGGQDPNAWDDGTTSRYKNFRYTCYASPAGNESASDYLSREGRFPKNWQNFYPNPANSSTSGNWNAVFWGPDVAYDYGSYGQSSNATYNPTQNPNHMRDNTRDWMIWYKKQVGFDGVRLDAVKHFPDWATKDFLWNLQHNSGWASGGDAMFAVGEYVGGKSDLDGWANHVENRAGTFDFALRDGIYQMISQGGGFDLGSMPSFQQNNRVFYLDGQYVHRTVPFVNNHDTFRPQLDTNGNYTGWNYGSQLAPQIDPFDPRLSAAYAVALAVDGSPQIFFEDLYNISNGQRYTHDPKNTSQLPTRSDLYNLIWCHQNLRFKDGAYKVRYQAQDHLVIERSGRAIISINDNFNTWQNHWVQTDFPAGTRLKDYSGANGFDIKVVNSSGWVNINTPPCNGTANLGRRGYAIWAPENATTNYNNAPIRTTQEWQMADDLGDSHPNSLQQGGALPANSTAQRTVGSIFVKSGEILNYEIYPEADNNSTTVKFYNGTSQIHSKTSIGSVTGSFTPNYTGWVTVKINNTNTSAPKRNAFVKLNYLAPATISTDSYPAPMPAGAGARIENAEKVETEFVNKLMIYPNPAKVSDVNVILTSQEEQITDLQVFDITGKLVHHEQITLYYGSNEYKLRLNSNLKTGMYFVSIPALNLKEKLVIR